MLRIVPLDQSIEQSGTAMEIAKLVLEYLRVIIWPVTVAFLVILFQAPLIRILTRLRNLGLLKALLLWT
jgi:hypothetical protein